MVHLSLEEAQLFRIMCAIFDRERIVYNMSVLAACGGQLPESYVGHEGLADWASLTKCKFIVTDQNGDPRLVIDFEPGFYDVVDVKEVEYKGQLKELLRASSVHYMALSRREMAELTDPQSQSDLFSLMAAHLDLEQLGLDRLEFEDLGPDDCGLDQSDKIR